MPEQTPVREERPDLASTVEELRRLLAKAEGYPEGSPLPWDLRCNEPNTPGVYSEGARDFVAEDLCSADAALIVAAVNALDTLLDAVERADRPRLDDLTEVVVEEQAWRVISYDAEGDDGRVVVTMILDALDDVATAALATPRSPRD